MSFTGLNAETINIIVQKHESGSFHFSTPCRLWDGFTLFTSGKGYATDKTGKQYSVEKGDILLLRKNDQYEISFDESCSYITSAITLKFDNDGDFPFPLPFKLKCHSEMIQNIYDIYRIWQSRTAESYTRCRIKILELYLDIIEVCNTESSQSGISAVIDYIHSNFKRNFSGSDIARYSSMSVSYMRAKFLKETGKTINAYRDTLRIKAAKEMLISGCFTIYETALELGYCDVYHFSKTFKKYTGISPGKYAAKSCTGFLNHGK